MIPKDEMETLVQELFNAFWEYSKDIGIDEESRLHPPASEEDISMFEKKLGWVFPPSYHQFLSLHNGWEDFSDVFTLIGISGEHTEKAVKDIEYTIEIYKKVWEEKYGEQTKEKLENFKSETDLSADNEYDAHIYLPDMYHFGTDFAGELFYFYPPSIDSDGEMKIIYRGQKGGEIIKQYPNFVEFLRSTLEYTKSLVD